MRKLFPAIAGFVGACLLLAGCDRSPDKVAFDSAPPDLKTSWSQAVADSRANHYLAANTNLVSLLRRDLSAAQMSAVQNELSDLNGRMNNAAARGDAEAKKAIETLQSMQQQRRSSGSAPH
jgi:hypothetical protein